MHKKRAENGMEKNKRERKWKVVYADVDDGVGWELIEKRLSWAEFWKREREWGQDLVDGTDEQRTEQGAKSA